MFVRCCANLSLPESSSLSESRPLVRAQPLRGVLALPRKPWQQLRRTCLPKPKKGPHGRLGDRQAEPAQGIERQGIGDVVANDGSWRTPRRLGVAHGVAMPPIGKRTLELHIAETLIPSEILDQRQPWRTQGKPGNTPRRDGQPGSTPGRHRAVIRRALGARRGWAKSRVVHACPLPRRHKWRQIARVAKKGKNQGSREGQPLFGRKLLTHPG